MGNNGKGIRVRIGESERGLHDADEHWINQQINRRRHDGQRICARVFVEDAFVNMILSTPACANSGGGGRPPNRQEKRLFDLWNKLGLNKTEFHGRNLTAFLKQVS
jgi:hypothetical protein